MTLRATLGAIILAGGTLASAAASATIITFSGLAGPDGTPLTTYTEGEFTVTNLGGFFQGMLSGNPPPSVFAGSNALGGEVAVTRGPFPGNGGELFTFASVDAGLSDRSGGVDADFFGLLNGNVPFVNGMGFSFSSVAGAAFATIANPMQFAGVAIDTLTIFLDGKVNLDNIVVNPVPGPIAGAGLPGLILASGGLLILGWWRRRRQLVA